MNAYFTILVFFLFSVTVFSQDSLHNESAVGKFRVGVFYAFDYNLSSGEIATAPYTGYSTNYDGFNFNTGVSLEYKFSPVMSIISGVGYSNKNFRATSFCEVCDIGFTPLPLQIAFELVEIPLAARYYYMRDFIGFFGEAGIVNHFKIGGENLPLEINQHFLSAKISAGVEYNFNRGYAMQFSTSYTQSLTNVFDNATYTYAILDFKLGIVKQL